MYKAVQTVQNYDEFGHPSFITIWVEMQRYVLFICNERGLKDKN